MNDQHPELATSPPVRSQVSMIALALGAATILFALFRAVQILSGRQTIAILAVVPYAAAGLALTIRSLRGRLPWLRGIATWAGGFLATLPAIQLVPVLSGPGDSTFWLLTIMMGIVFVTAGILLLRMGFKN
jgi:hypothetical protein